LAWGYIAINVNVIITYTGKMSLLVHSIVGLQLFVHDNPNSSSPKVLSCANFTANSYREIILIERVKPD